MIEAPIGVLFNKFGNLSTYNILIAQGFNFSSVLYLKYFGTSQLEFEMVELYKNKIEFTEEQALFYPLIGAKINKQRTLAIFSQFF